VTSAQAASSPALLTPITAERPGNSKGLMPIRANHQKVSASPSKLTEARTSVTKAMAEAVSGAIAATCAPGNPAMIRSRPPCGSAQTGAIRATRPK